MSVYNRDHRTRYRDVSGSTTLLATDDLSATPRTLVTGRAGYTVKVQSIAVDVVTDNAATLTFRASAGTPVKVAATKASPGIGPIVFDLGEEGFALTQGKNFELVNSAAGLAAAITWQGYMQPTGTLTPDQI